MARQILREVPGTRLSQDACGRETDIAIDHSELAHLPPADTAQVMFEHFPHSVGVANIRRFEAALTHQPRYITQGMRGAGFAEVARAILCAQE